MTKPKPPSSCAFPPPIVEGVRVAVDTCFGAICGAKPTPYHLDAKVLAGPSIAGIISFIGDVPWSYALVLTQESAPQLARKYFGMDISFECADMGDMVGELANVLAGGVIAELEQRRMTARMSLPTVARGSNLEFVPESGAGVVRLDYLCPQGPFWLRLMTAAAKPAPMRLPGS